MSNEFVMYDRLSSITFITRYSRCFMLDVHCIESKWQLTKGRASDHTKEDYSLSFRPTSNPNMEVVIHWQSGPTIFAARMDTEAVTNSITQIELCIDFNANQCCIHLALVRCVSSISYNIWELKCDPALSLLLWFPVKPPHKCTNKIYKR